MVFEGRKMSKKTKDDEYKSLKESIKKYFPLSAPNDYEAVLNKTHYPIGVNQDYPAELRKMLSAATISYFLQSKSIDYIRKNHLKDSNYEEDSGGKEQLDRRIRTACLLHVRAIIEGLVSYRSKTLTVATIGQFISDATLARIPYSLERAFAEADKGALFESLVIVRMALEQLCWALNIRDYDTATEIQTTPVTKSITYISKLYNKVGRLNGWLSNHAHWSYEAHIKAIFEKPGFIMQASPMFKGCSYITLVIFSDLFLQIISNELKEFIDWETVSKEIEFKNEIRDFNFEQEAETLKNLLKPFYPDICNLFP